MRKIWMSTAEKLAERSECKRASVGCLITTADLRHVLGNGYNGGPKDLGYVCETGDCHCLHAEDNAICDSGSEVKDKVMFVTMFPCRECTTRIINSGFSALYYRNPYKKDSRHWAEYDWCFKALEQSNIKVIQI